MFPTCIGMEIFHGGRSSLNSSKAWSSLNCSTGLRLGCHWTRFCLRTLRRRDLLWTVRPAFDFPDRLGCHWTHFHLRTLRRRGRLCTVKPTFDFRGRLEFFLSVFELFEGVVIFELVFRLRTLRRRGCLWICFRLWTLRRRGCLRGFPDWLGFYSSSNLDSRSTIIAARGTLEPKAPSQVHPSWGW